MRLRHIPGAEERIEKNDYVVKDGRQYRGGWDKFFKNSYPIEIEVGMGKGRFITEKARQHGQVNYIGIERYSSVLLKALQKRADIELDNLHYLWVDARILDELFAASEIQTIYLNFSDPWPKDRHEKRRLTSKNFLDIYDKILTKEGTIEFKTDNRRLFDYSLESIPNAGWRIKEFTFDLHRSQWAKDNIMTEYEEKFLSEGKPICKLIAFRN